MSEELKWQAEEIELEGKEKTNFGTKYGKG